MQRRRRKRTMARPTTTAMDRSHVDSSGAVRWTALAVAATTFAVSVSAFTSHVPMHRRPVCFSADSTRRHAVTDPDTLLRDTIRRRSVDLEALENVYNLSGGFDEPSRIEQDSMETRSSKKQENTQKANTGSSRESNNVVESMRLQTIGNDLQEILGRELTDDEWSAEAGKINMEAIRQAIGGGTETKTSTNASHSRSSTMPGFGTKHMTASERSFRDGIKLAEQRSGRQLSEYVDKPKSRKDRSRLNSEAMYKSSASVPDSLVRFANEIHLEDRITPKEEVELGEKTQEAIRLQSIYDNLQEKLGREPTDAEWCAEAGKINMEAISQAIDEGMEAKNRLVTSNLRMVQGVVNIYIRNGLGGQYNAGDMMQEGVMALIRAAEKFDPARGFRFSTYAMYWIRAAVKRSQIYQSRVITVPQRLYENHKKLIRIEKEYMVTLGRRPTYKELSDATNLSETQVARCMTAMQQECFSLDQSIQNKKKPNSGDPEQDSLHEIVTSRTDDGEYAKIRRLFMREDLIETLQRHLDEEEVDLLLLRYGLKDDKNLPTDYQDKPLTIAEVSRVVGLKPDKVRRTIHKALKELKRLIGEEWRDFERQLE